MRESTDSIRQSLLCTLPVLTMTSLPALLSVFSYHPISSIFPAAFMQQQRLLYGQFSEMFVKRLFRQKKVFVKSSVQMAILWISMPLRNLKRLWMKTLKIPVRPLRKTLKARTGIRKRRPPYICKASQPIIFVCKTIWAARLCPSITQSISFFL